MESGARRPPRPDRVGQWFGTHRRATRSGRPFFVRRGGQGVFWESRGDIEWYSRGVWWNRDEPRGGRRWVAGGTARGRDGSGGLINQE